MKILLVEDEQNLADAVCEILRKHNYSVNHVDNGEDGLDEAMTQTYDVILLDIMLPKLNGLKVLKELRKEDKHTAVIMLTALSEIEDKIAGLNKGADDYLPKPFNMSELIARIQAVARRKGQAIVDRQEILFDDIKLNTHELLLYCNDKFIQLSLKESHVLEFLIQNS